MVTKAQAFLTKKKAQPFYAIKLSTKDKGYAPQQKERKQRYYLIFPPFFLIAIVMTIRKSRLDMVMSLKMTFL